MKHLCTSPRFGFLLTVMTLFVSTAFGQNSSLNVKNGSDESLLYVSETGRARIGIGTDTSASLTLIGNDGLLARGLFGTGTVLSPGAGTRMMWYPRKASFRAGSAEGTEWNDSDIGDYSVAMGNSTTASGIFSTALGVNTVASGYNSTALGFRTIASGTVSTSLGYYSTASGDYSVVIGRGIDGSNRLSNTITNSLMVGFNSTIPTLFVGPGSGAGTRGRVGIGTTAPQRALHVADTIYSSVGGFMFPDGTVQATAAASSSGNTLDKAYDQGGAGAGRTIIADNGAVNIQGVGGLTVNGNVGVGTTSATYPLTILPGTSLAGAYIDHNQTGAGDTRGLMVDVAKTYNGSYAIYGGSFGATNDYGTGSTRGIYSVATGTSSGIKIGVAGSATGAGNHYGVSGTVTGSGTQYGVYGAATGTDVGDVIGIYGTATGNGTLWAGYFDGNVYTNGLLNIDGGIAVGSATASGSSSVAFGSSASAIGNSSAAIGSFTTARSVYTVAIGRRAKANHAYSVVIAANGAGSDSVATGDSETMVLQATKGFYITNAMGQAPVWPSGRLIHTSSGAYLSTGGTWTNSSSRSLKENILDLPLEQAQTALLQLSPVTYNYKVDEKEKHVGFIAEDVPDLIATKDRKGLSPMDIVAVLTKVVQNQESQIELLEHRIKILENRSTARGER